MKYIEDNMQLLLSLALDHWFAHTNISYTGEEQIVADETLISYREKIRDELRVSRQWIRLYLRAEQIACKSLPDQSCVFTCTLGR